VCGEREVRGEGGKESEGGREGGKRGREKYIIKSRVIASHANGSDIQGDLMYLLFVSCSKWYTGMALSCSANEPQYGETFNFNGISNYGSMCFPIQTS
jgi:hypothetical protein